MNYFRILLLNIFLLSLLMSSQAKAQSPNILSNFEASRISVDSKEVLIKLTGSNWEENSILKVCIGTKEGACDVYPVNLTVVKGAVEDSNLHFAGVNQDNKIEKRVVFPDLPAALVNYITVYTIGFDGQFSNSLSISLKR